jgi:phage terminase small subunit
MDRPLYELAEEDYMNGMKYKDIADKYNVSLNTVKSWKTRYKWSKDNKKSVHTKNEKVCTQNNSMQKEKDTIKEPISEAVKKLIKNNELTEQQKDFCMYYVKYRNKTKAYMKAYNCGYKNANANAHKIWSNKVIRKEIDRQLEELRNGIMFDIKDLIQLNMDIAFADMKDYTAWGKKEVEVDRDEDGEPIKVEVNYVDFKDSEEVDGTLISEVKKGKDGVSIKLQDKGKSIDFLYKHLMYVDEDAKRMLDVAYKKFQNEKLQEEVKKLKGDKENRKEPVRIVDDI